MNNQEFDNYVKTLMSMCTDYLLGGLNKETYLSNLEIMEKQMSEKDDQDISRDAKAKELLQKFVESNFGIAPKWKPKEYHFYGRTFTWGVDLTEEQIAYMKAGEVFKLKGKTHASIDRYVFMDSYNQIREQLIQERT
jgi:hypothetical protein